MTIKVLKPKILDNEYHPEHEEKDVVEPTTKTSEDVHGGDEITQSMKDQRFAQQQNNNMQNNENQQNNDNNAQIEQQNHQNEKNDQLQDNNETNQQQNEAQSNNEQQNENEQSQSNSESEQQTQSQNESEQQQNNDSGQNDQQTEQQQNNDKQSQSNNDSEQQNLQTAEQQQNNTQRDDQNDESVNETNQDDETEEKALDDSVDDDYQEEDDGDDYYDDEEDDSVDDDYQEEDDDYQEDTTQYNTEQAFKINEISNIERQLYLTFYRLVEYLSDEEKQPTLMPGQTLVLNVKKLMMRQYERKPINAYYYYRARSQVILILDNSGSMAWLIDELDTFFRAALKRKDVIIYVAPNGKIVGYYDDKTRRFELIDHEDAIRQMIQSSLPVIYVGDFDGANTPIELSWTNRVYWICSETRYKYFSHHDWVGRCLKEDDDGNCIKFKPYHEDDFKGFFGRTFNDEEMITVLKEFAKNVQKQRFWYDKHDIKDFSKEG